MLLKQNMIILMMVMSLTAFSCVDVPTTAPPRTKTIQTAIDSASAKIDVAVDLKTFEEETATKSNDRKDEIE